MKRFVCLTMVVALCICGTAAAQEDTRVLTYGGWVLELRPPAEAPSLGEVLDAHGVVLDQADSVELFVAGILRASSFGAHEVHALQVSWIGADPPSDPMRDPWSVEVAATIGSDTALVNMYVADGGLHVALTRYDQDGQPTSVKLECVILEPVVVLESVGDPQPLRTYYLAATAGMYCTCDNGKGLLGCTITRCDDGMTTCPEGQQPNRGSCGWVAMAITVEVSVEMTSDSGVAP